MHHRSPEVFKFSAVKALIRFDVGLDAFLGLEPAVLSGADPDQMRDQTSGDIAPAD